MFLCQMISSVSIKVFKNYSDIHLELLFENQCIKMGCININSRRNVLTVSPEGSRKTGRETDCLLNTSLVLDQRCLRDTKDVEKKPTEIIFLFLKVSETLF